MDCDRAREGLSAVLDAEDPTVAWSALEEHLAGCAECRRWQDTVHALTRRVRLQPDGVAPPPPEALLVAARSRRRSRREWWTSPLPVRAGLVLVAVVQLAVSGPLLFLGSYRDAPIHIAHEMGSLDVAVAIGLLVAARRPVRAIGMLALVGTAALLLMVTAGMDLASGRTTWADESPHLLVLAGWMLLRRLAALSLSGGERPPSVLGRLDAIRRCVASLLRPLAPAATASVPTAAAGAAAPAVGEAEDERMAS